MKADVYESRWAASLPLFHVSEESPYSPQCHYLICPFCLPQRIWLIKILICWYGLWHPRICHWFPIMRMEVKGRSPKYLRVYCVVLLLFYFTLASAQLRSLFTPFGAYLWIIFLLLSYCTIMPLKVYDDDDGIRRLYLITRSGRIKGKKDYFIWWMWGSALHPSNSIELSCYPFSHNTQMLKALLEPPHLTVRNFICI